MSCQLHGLRLNKAMMQPEIQQTRVNQDRRQEGVGALVSPSLSIDLDTISFGQSCAKVRALFLSEPTAFDGIGPSVPGTLPSIRSMILNSKLEEQVALVA
jgi:hypothetical protein